MKKILSLLCATALLTNVFAVLMTAKADEPTTPTTPTVFGTSFEQLNVGGELDPFADDAGLTTEAPDDGEFHWVGATGDTGMIKAYGDETPYAYDDNDNNRSTVFGTAANEKYLALETSDRLLRTFNAVAKDKLDNNPPEIDVAPVSLADADLYADLLVKFTGSEERPASQDGDKIAVWFKTVEADPENEIVGETNLVITAGYFGTLNDKTYTPCEASKIANTVTNRDYIVELTNPINPEKWYRLTIKAANNVMASGDKVPGFIVYLDGEPLAATDGSYDIGGGLTSSSFDAANAVFFGDKQLFPSLIASGAKDLEVTGLSLAGTGSIDDLSLNTLAPNFAVPDTMFTLTWAHGLESLTYTIDDGSATEVDDLDSGKQVIPLKPGYAPHTIAITETYADGYKYRDGDWTADSVNATLSEKTFRVIERPAGGVASGNIVPFKAFFEVGGTEYAVFSQAYDAAKNDGTIKILADDAVIDDASGKGFGKTGSAVIDAGETVTIDLNGKTLTGNGANPTIVNFGGTLTIKGGTLAGKNGALDATLGTTTIESGTIGSVTGTSLIITGGSFYQESNAAFYLISAVNTLEYKATRNGFYYDVSEIPQTCKIGDQYYGTIAEAVAAAEDDAVITICDDMTLTDKMIVAGKTLTIDADEAVTITGQLRVVDGANVTIGSNITFVSDKNPTVFVLGDPAVKTPGTAKSTLVVDGVVINNNATYDQAFAICGNGSDTQGADITINGEVVNAQGIAIYNPQPGTLTVNGTVSGYSAISIKDGTLVVNEGAVVAATGEKKAYAGNGDGDSPTGDAVIVPYYPEEKGYGTPVVTINDGTFTVADTTAKVLNAYDYDGVTAPEDSFSNITVSGGTFDTDFNGGYCEEGYVPGFNSETSKWGVEEGVKIKFETVRGKTPSPICATYTEVGEIGKLIALEDLPDLGKIDNWEFECWAEVDPMDLTAATKIDDENNPDGYYLSYDTTFTALWTSTEEPEQKAFDVIIAGETKGYDTFAEALAAANAAIPSAKIVLNDDVTTAGKLTVTGNVTLDLNGKTIAQDQTVEHTSGVLIVAHGGTLTIDDSSEPSAGKIDSGMAAYAAVAMTGKGDTADAKTATLVVKAGTLQGRHYGIVGNGTAGRGNTSVTIDGGVVKGLVENDCAGIYNPQGNSTVIVNGGVVEGAVGIYAKAGTITVNGGEVKAVGAFVEKPTFNGDGFNPCGDAIVLDSAAGYAGNVELTLAKGAKLTSANGFAVREAVTKGANTTLAIADAGATLTAPKGGLAVSDEFAAKLASNAATITGYTIAIDGVCGNDSLLAAIGKVADNGTITLLANVTDATGISIDSKKTFTVDFNGFTYTVNKPGAGSTGTTTQAFQLLKDQTITFKNGTINASADNLVPATVGKNIKRFFQSYANLTLENMTLDGTNLYLNPADNAVCEFANGTVALTGSTSIDAPENCIAVSVDNWKGKYPDGVDVTIDTTGTIDGVKVWTEGTGDATAASLTLTAGTITSLTVEGEDTDFTVTKDPEATVTAPEGYEWDEDGKLVEVSYPDAATGAFSAFIADAETGAPAQYPNVAGVAFPVEVNGFPVYDFAMSTLDDNHLYAIGFKKNEANAIGFLVAEYEIKRDSKGAIKGIKVPATDANRKWFVQLPEECLDPSESGCSYTYTKALAITAETADSVTFKLAMEADKGLGTLTVNRTTGEGAWTLDKTSTSMGIAYDAEADVLAYATTAGLVIGETTVPVEGIGAVRRPVLSVGDSTFLVGAGTNDSDAHSIWKVTAAGAELILPASALKAAADNGAKIRIEDMALAAVDANTFLYLVDRESGKVLAWQWDATAKNVVNPNQFEVIDVKAAVAAQFTGLTFANQFQSIAFTSKGEMLVGLGKSNNQTSGVFAFSEVPNAEVTVELENATLTVDGVAVADGATFEAEPGKAYTLVATADDGYENATIEGATPGEDGKYVFAADTTVTVGATEVPGLELLIADQEYNAETNPYVITSLSDLKLFQKDLDSAEPKYADKAIMQTADIDLDGIVWAGIGSFSGTYDGAGHLIDNVVLADGEYTGVFKTLNGGTIKNLTVELNGFSPATASKFGGAVIGDVKPGSTIQCVKATGEMSCKHNCAGIAVRAYNSNFIDCTNAVHITTTYTKVGGIVAYVVDSNNAASTFVRCVNEGDLTSTTTEGNSGAGGIIGYQGASGAAKTLEGCVNIGTITAPNAGAFIGYNNTGNTTGLGGNVAAANTVPVAKKEANSTVTGFTYALVADDKATFVADNALEAGNTYTLYAAATPAIELAADESITFDKNGFELTATGIVAGEGAELNEPVVAGTHVTYSAKAASTGPTIDDEKGTQVLISDNGTITNVNSTVELVLPVGWGISKDGEIYQIIDGEQVWGKFPAYYAAAVGEDGKVAISLSEAANLIVQSASDVAEMDDGETEILAVGEEEVGLAVKNTYKGLYYGLATCATVDGDYAAPAVDKVETVEKDGDLIRLEAPKSGAACFYKMWVSDVAPQAE